MSKYTYINTVDFSTKVIREFNDTTKKRCDSGYPIKDKMLFQVYTKLI